MTDDELLTPKGGANDRLKADLLDQTVRRLRFSRRVRLASRVAVCAACFGLGVGVAFLQPAPEPRTIFVEVAGPPVAHAPGSPVEPPRVLSPAELELEAEKTLVKAEAARRFREAGDRYLREYSDYRAALRCYRNFLDEAEPGDLEIMTDDTWLLTSLKRARAQESTQ